MSDKASPGAKRERRPLRSMRISIRYQLLITFIVVITLTFGAVSWAVHHSLTRHVLQELATELQTVARVTAAGIDGDMHQSLVESEVPAGRPLDDGRYRALVEWLYQVQVSYGKVVLPDGAMVYRVYPYTYVATDDPGMMMLVGSAGALEPEPAGAEFRELDTLTLQVMKDGFSRTSAQTEDYIVDRWGTWVTGTSPIYNAGGKVVGAVGIDIKDITVYSVQDHLRTNILPGVVLAYFTLLGFTLLITYSLGRPIISLTRSAEGLITGNYPENVIPRTKSLFSNEITTLTEVFDQMAREVQAREKTLAESQARYQALVDSLPGPAFLSDGTGSMRFISPQIEELLGYSPEEWTSGDGRLWFQLIHPDHWDRVEAMLGQTEQMPFSSLMEVPILHKDGHYHWIESRFSRYSRFQDTFLTVGIILDIELRHQDRVQLEAYTEELGAAYQKLQDTQQKLVRSARLATAGELAAGVAHEINNPLTAAHGLAQFLIGKLSEEDEEYEPLSQIIRNTDRISRIVHQLRGYTLDSTERTLVNLNDAAEGALILLQTQLAKHEIALVKEYAPNLPLVRGVPHQLEQVVVNLITNARDAITEKGNSGQITLKTWQQSSDLQVCLSVSDTGVGISSQDLKDLFTPFFTTKLPGRGTGLGLSISDGIISEHDGEILVNSKLGTGSTFTVVLPAREQ